MANTYLEYSFKIKPTNPGSEILMAELAELGFESFVETDEGLQAYLAANNNKAVDLTQINLLNSSFFKVSYEVKEIEDKDWNAQWESQFKPITLSETCRIRAPFHPPQAVPYEIIINPKMAFGTGHHATTRLMVQLILQNNLAEKEVLDMGCGTGILSILAEKMGAKHIDAIDIDPWSYRNTLENASLNNCKHICAFEGDVTLLKDKQYSVIFANIIRNVLLRDMAQYATCLSKGGLLFLSGFYERDTPTIKTCCQELGLAYKTHQTSDEWVGMQFYKC